MRIRSAVVVASLVATAVFGTTSPVGAADNMCDGKAATHIGTIGNDVLRGTPGDDVFVGLGGNDRIFGGAGNDTACGGPGNDVLRGQQGNDTLLGGRGDDVMFGNAGPDTLIGGDGSDRAWGGVGPDELFGGEGHDVLNAGHGNDFAFGGVGNDILHGSTGSDELSGGQGTDTLTGGRGFDDLFGDGGNDLLTGGPGDDFVAGGPGINRCRVDLRDVFIDCQSGNVSGDSGRGNGDFVPNLSPEFVIPSPDGPSYVMHIDAAPPQGQSMTIRVSDANGGLLFHGSGPDPVFSNVHIAGGVPALVEVEGADFWSLSFVKTKILFDDLVLKIDQGSQVFGIAPALDGLPQTVEIAARNTGGTTSEFRLVSVGDEGIILELSDSLVPGEQAVFTGTLRASAVYVAILTGSVEWEFELVDG
jgi:hypothetical protein